MPQLVVLIINDPAKADDVLNAWIEAGVTGASSIDAYGAGRLLPGDFREDLPLMPSLADMLHGREEHNRLIFSVVADDFDVDRLVAGAEALVGKLSDPHTGILFTVPVTQAWGLRPPRR
jgi:nitrogen regulatory protein P-II 1